jgi:PTS system sucrose-specific IIC component
MKDRIKYALKIIGDIFVPLLPGIICAGLCGGFASLIAQTVPNLTDNSLWGFVYQVLSLINTAMMSFLTAWAGYRAAQRFGGTPILGGMLGMITSLDGINRISAILGLYNQAVPLDSVLCSGKGGVLAVIAGALLIAVVEKAIRSVMPASIDVVFTPLLTMLLCVVPYILFIMPLFGYASEGIVWLFSRACLSENVFIRASSGYFAAAFFLPLVAAGMHHGLVALYSVQLQELGFVTLYPALAMAGAGQVGAALALWKKARKVGNDNLCSVISGALPAGLLGVGEPLIYGVTLPLGKPFLTAGLGAGFGGAFIM